MRNKSLAALALFACISAGSTQAADFYSRCDYCSTAKVGDNTTLQAAIKTAQLEAAPVGTLIDVMKVTQSTYSYLEATRHFEVASTPVNSAADLYDVGFDREGDQRTWTPPPDSMWDLAFQLLGGSVTVYRCQGRLPQSCH